MTVAPRRQRWRATGSALLRAARWTLTGLVLAFALIGFLQLTRGTAVRHVQGVGTDGASVAVSEPEFPLMVTMLAGASLAGGHRVEVLLNGDGTYPRMWDDLRSAHRSITLQLYYGAPGRMARTIGDILRERLAAGVRVYILYDAFGTVDIPAERVRGVPGGWGECRAVPPDSPLQTSPGAEPLTRARHRHRWPHWMDWRVRYRR